MSKNGFNEDVVRSRTRRILQLMNQYSLMEIEFEDKENEQSLKVRRDSEESSPPLLEGRSEVLPGQVRSPTVGRLEWAIEDGEYVDRGEKIAEVRKQDEEIPVKAPCGGQLTDKIDKEYVQFGDTIARVVQSESNNEEESES